MNNILGREINVKRGRLQESMVIKSVKEIVPEIFSVTGENSKRQMTLTMTKSEIFENLIGGAI